MRDYVVLDVENPNTRGNSLCAIGIIVVQDGKVVDKIYSLINPEDRFDRNNTAITGIDGSMVLESPTLPQFWPEIQDLLTGHVIVGHNITYDLSVICKSLDRYEMSIPDFRYIDTLALSRQYIPAPSYKLGSLVKNLGFSYQEHQALEDAVAALYLFAYLQKEHTIGLDDALVYQYECHLTERMDEKLISHLNDLHGIVAGITADGKVNDKELAYLEKWVDENAQYRNYAMFDRIITQLNLILEDGVVTPYEQQVILAIAKSIDHSTVYTDVTLAIQVLDGILKGIVCDKEIASEEIESLQTWLSENDYLAGVYPYDKILHAVTSVLQDGLITEDEKTSLLSEFDEVLHPVKQYGAIDLSGKSFCLTGDFAHGKRSEMEALLEGKGAVKKSGVSAKLDYLFVGSLGSDAWKFGNAGGKIAKAQELREKGKPIQIISEEDLFKYLV